MKTFSSFFVHRHSKFQPLKRNSQVTSVNNEISSKYFKTVPTVSSVILLIFSPSREENDMLFAHNFSSNIQNIAKF